jgi:opacity protein-like surface antigen
MLIGGAEVDYGYTRDTQQYNTAGGVAGVRTDMHEVSASYVYRFTPGRIKPFATVGFGGVEFDTKRRTSQAALRTCPWSGLASFERSRLEDRAPESEATRQSL